MDRIRNASHDELRAILRTLYDDPDDGDMKQRISDHLRVLQYFNGVRDCPMTTQRVRDASEAELRAVLLTICDDHVSILNRTLDFLRVIAVFKEVQDETEDAKSHQKGKTSGQSDVKNHISQAQLDGLTEGIQVPRDYAEMTCVNCETAFDEEDNHSMACNHHEGELRDPWGTYGGW